MLILIVENLEPDQTNGQRGRWVVVVECSTAPVLGWEPSSAIIAMAGSSNLSGPTRLAARLQTSRYNHCSAGVPTRRPWPPTALVQSCAPASTAPGWVYFANLAFRAKVASVQRLVRHGHFGCAFKRRCRMASMARWRCCGWCWFARRRLHGRSHDRCLLAGAGMAVIIEEIRQSV